jgi:hypothetical protein
MKILDWKGNPYVPLKSVTVSLTLSEWPDISKIRAFIAAIERDTKTVCFITSNDTILRIQLFVPQFDAEYWKSLKEANNVQVFVSDSASL